MNSVVVLPDENDATQVDLAFSFNNLGSATTSSAQLGTLNLARAPLGRRTKAAASANKKVEAAVYGYIQAVRALGRDRIMTSEIATALSISAEEVVSALDALKDKGVKIAQ